jgi:hypothetical protein
VSFWSDWREGAVFSMTYLGGEAPAPSVDEGNGGGGKFPSQISHRKDQPGSLRTKGGHS